MLSNKVMFVTGGTGYLGSAIVRLAHKSGAKVYFSFNNNEESAYNLVDECKGTEAVRLDTRGYEDVRNTINELHKKVEAFDILVNNAGTSQIMPFSLLEEADLDLLINVNIKGTFYVTKAVCQKMLKRKSGAIINIGSIAGHRMLDVPVHYALTKAAISGFTLSLAAELKRFGIRVNSVVPGLLEDGVGRSVPDELKEDFFKYCATGRAGTAEEVAEVICFVASEKASYINGQNIFVDGGL